MKATTVKIEGDLLSDIEAVKPGGQSVSAFVRELLRRSLERERLRVAAEDYADYVREHPDEREWLSEWDRAHLAAPLPEDS